MKIKLLNDELNLTSTGGRPTKIDKSATIWRNPATIKAKDTNPILNKTIKSNPKISEKEKNRNEFLTSLNRPK